MLCLFHKTFPMQNQICISEHDRMIDLHDSIPAILPKMRKHLLFILVMSYYIDTENTDMQKFAFEQVQGIDLPFWKDLQSADEIEISHVSGTNSGSV